MKQYKGKYGIKVLTVITILSLMLCALTSCGENTTDTDVATDTESAVSSESENESKDSKKSGKIENIELGEYVQMGTYYGEPILWRCVAFEKISGYDDDGNPIIDSTDTVTEYQDGYLPLMLSDKIICLKPFDAETSLNWTTGSHSRSSYRSAAGSNYWVDSNIRSWLNSNESAGNVTWLCGNPPSDRYVWKGYNDYADEAGFLTNFTEIEIDSIKMVTQKSIVAYAEYSNRIYDLGSESPIYGDETRLSVVRNYDEAYSELVTDTIFLLDGKQVNNLNNNQDVLGSDYYLGSLTEQCVSNSEYEIDPNKKGGYWLRSPDDDNYSEYGGTCYGYSTRIIVSGNVDYDSPTNYGFRGVRPAFYLNPTKDSFASGSGTAETPYTISGGSGS